MKILFFHRANDYTGSTRALANMIETEYQDEDVYVVTPNINNQGFLSEVSNIRIKQVYYPMIKGKRIKLISYVISNIHMFLIAVTFGAGFDVFYINTIAPYPAAIAAWLLRKKITYHIHEKFVDNSHEQKFIEAILNNTESTRIYVSEYVMAQYPAIKGQSIVKYNKLSKSFTSRVVVTPLALRARRNIIMISSLSIAKGVLSFIELAKKLPQYNFTLLLSANQDQINAFFKDEIPQNVSVVSQTSDIHSFLQKTDLLLNLSIPSLWIETFGLTIIEAMIYGIPAVVPNVGGPVELVTDGYNGYCVDVTDLDVVKNKINESLSASTYEMLATNALEKAKLFV